LVGGLIGTWKINIPLQHKNIILGTRSWVEILFRQVKDGQRYSNLSTVDLVAFLFSDDPKWERTGRLIMTAKVKAIHPL